MKRKDLAASIRDFVTDESAQSAVEYVLLACILITASYGAIRLFREVWANKFNAVKDTRTGFSGMLLP